MFHESLQAQFTEYGRVCACVFFYSHVDFGKSTLPHFFSRMFVGLLSLTIFIFAWANNNLETKMYFSLKYYCKTMNLQLSSCISTAYTVRTSYEIFSLFSLYAVTQSCSKVLIDWTEIWETFSRILSVRLLSFFSAVFVFDAERIRWKISKNQHPFNGTWVKKKCKSGWRNYNC